MLSLKGSPLFPFQNKARERSLQRPLAFLHQLWPCIPAFVVLFSLFMVGFMGWKALPAMGAGLDRFFLSEVWEPVEGDFGLLGQVAASLLLGLCACFLTLPLSLGVAIHLAFYSHSLIRKVAMPIRVAVTGAGASPGLDLTLHLLGRERTLSRIERAIAFLAERN